MADEIELINREHAAFDAGIAAVVKMLADDGKATPTLVAMNRTGDVLTESWRLNVTAAMQYGEAGRRELVWLISKLLDQTPMDLTGVGVPNDAPRPDATMLILQGMGQIEEDSEAYPVIVLELTTNKGERAAVIYRFEPESPEGPRLLRLGIGAEIESPQTVVLH